MKKSLVYTCTGDKGTTSLVGGQRVSKTHLRLEAYGTIDELNSYLGVLMSLVKDKAILETLQYVQHCLFVVGAYLATNQEKDKGSEESCITDYAIELLEKSIDEMDSTLPVLKTFILPGGSLSASCSHVCRTVCRRAERCILRLEVQGICEVDKKVKRFVNRLSDYFFVLARKLNQFSEHEEIFWDKSCK